MTRLAVFFSFAASVLLIAHRSMDARSKRRNPGEISQDEGNLCRGAHY